MKRQLTIGLMMIFIILSGCLYAQNKPFEKEIFEENSYLENAECFKASDGNEGLLQLPIQSTKKAAGSTEWYEPSVIIMYNLEKKDYFRYTRTYNNTGMLLTELVEGWINEAWINATFGEFTYDENDNWLTCIRKTWDGKAWINYADFVCTYNENGKMLTQVQRMWKNNQWEGSLRWTNTYDNAGNMTEQFYERWENDKWNDSSRWTWTFDENNNELTENNKTIKNGKWQDIQGYICTYDDKNQLLTQEFAKSGEPTGRLTHTYNEKGYMVTKLNELYQDGAWVSNWRNKWTEFDDRGNWLKQIFEAYRNGSWDTKELNTRGTRTFNGQGNKTSEFYERWMGGDKYESDWRGTWTFDESGKNLTLYIYETFESKENLWFKSQRDTYSYDNSGNKLTELSELNTGSLAEERWTINWDYVWAYDENNNGISFEAAIKPSREAFAIYYNNMAVNWPCPLFEVMKATATYTKIANKSTVENAKSNEATKVYTTGHRININNAAGIAGVTIADLNGRSIYNGNSETISTNTWANGMYIVKVSDNENNISIHKVMVK